MKGFANNSQHHWQGCPRINQPRLTLCRSPGYRKSRRVGGFHLYLGLNSNPSPIPHFPKPIHHRICLLKHCSTLHEMLENTVDIVEWSPLSRLWSCIPVTSRHASWLAHGQWRWSSIPVWYTYHLPLSRRLLVLSMSLSEYHVEVRTCCGLAIRCWARVIWCWSRTASRPICS